jgi:hypothetical protein
VPLAILAFLVAIADVPGLLSAPVFPRWAALSVGAAAILAYSPAVRITPAHVAGGLFIAWSAFGALWSVSPWDTAGAGLQLVFLAIVFCLGAEARDLRWTWTALALGATVSAVVALFQVGGVPIFVVPGVNPDIPGSADPLVGAGLFGNKNAAAQFGALAFVGFLFGTTPSWWGVIPLAGSATMLALPMSRGALAAAFIGTLASVAKTARCSARGKWLIFGGVVALSVAAIAIDLYFIRGRVITSVLPRLRMWELTAVNLNFFGWGAGSYGFVFPFDHASNDALELVFESGIGAVLLGFVVCYGLGIRKIDGIFEAEFVVLVAFLVEGLTAFPWHGPATAFVAALAAGRLAGARHRERDPQWRRGSDGLYGFVRRADHGAAHVVVGPGG